MKRLLTLGVATIAFALVACGGGESGKTDTAQHDDMAKKTESAAQQMATEHPGQAGGSPEGGDAPKLTTGSEITLTGNMGCGHCNFQIGNHCTAAMQTADGQIVIFDGVAEDSEMFQNRMDGAKVEVAGVVSYDADGVAHMKLTNTPM
ncbi:MAG: hypothetical protein R3E97_03010 [Candidatus Eisenbacteria bacterium]